MRRLGVIIALLGLVAIAVPVMAQDPPHEHIFDPHPHMLLQSPELGEIDLGGEIGVVPALVGLRKCVDLAGNQSVPLHAHHQHLHFGDSGVSLDFETFESQSGNAVIPTAPFPSPLFPPLPWSNCEDFATFLPLPLIPEE